MKTREFEILDHLFNKFKDDLEANTYVDNSWYTIRFYNGSEIIVKDNVDKTEKRFYVVNDNGIYKVKMDVKYTCTFHEYTERNFYKDKDVDLLGTDMFIVNSMYHTGRAHSMKWGE